MKPMNVMVLTPWYPTKDHRYAGVFVREYAKAVQDRCNVVVLHCGVADRTLSHWWAVTKECDKDLVGDIPSYRVLFRPSRIRGVSWFRRLASICRAVSIVSKEHGRPDLVHAHVYSTGWAALLTGRLLRIPVVISEHFSAFPRGTLSRAQICQARWIFRMADAVLPVSHALQSSLEQHGVKAAFHVVPNVVDTELFSFHAPIPASDGRVHLLAVSSFEKNKALAVLFRALAQVSWQGQPWCLDVVARDGPEAALHYQMVKNLRIAANVKFHGQMLKSEVAQLMREADLFVLPSLVETFSVATAEALVSGIPVLVTRCGGPQEFVTERSGTVVPPGDAEALADALATMIQRLPSYDRAAIAQEAKERFCSARVGAMLYELYAQLVRSPSRSMANSRRIVGTKKHA